MNPTPKYLRYLKYHSYIDMSNGRAPSLHLGVLSATTVLASEILKMVLGRGNISYAPRSQQFDFFYNTHSSSWIPWGNRNWRQKILMWIIKREMKKN
jgi:hypothetical protein